MLGVNVDVDVIALGVATRLALKYVENVVALVCLIVPPSLVTIPSPAATAVVPMVEPPSIKFSSVAVEVTPSNIFNSVAVDVTAVPPILSEAISKASVTSVT